jgi:hypothetical protein
MISNGDKLVVTKTVAHFLKEGDVVEVTNVADDGVISFAFGDGFMHMGVMSSDECESHFEKVKEEKADIPAITEEYIAEIMENSEFETFTTFDKCTIVSCRLPNGFVITESSACVSPENYDEDMGVEICFDKIADKIWELEAYRLQQQLWEEECDYCPCCCGDCEECEYDDEFDECLDTDLDCDDCEDFNCPYNSNNYS